MSTKNRYFISLDFEVRVPKRNLNRGVSDENHEVWNETVAHLDEIYKPDRYQRTETLDSIIYSVRSDLPARPFLQLRSACLIVMGIDFDYREQHREDSIEKELANATVGQMVTLSQHCIYDYTVIYPKFRWREYPEYIDLPPKHVDGLRVQASGIQIYASDYDFVTEMDGDIAIISGPLRHILRSFPYVETLSVRIE